MAGRYRAYPEYRGSGVEWIGVVPIHWYVRRIKESANLVNGYPFDSKRFDPFKGMPLIRIRDLNSSTPEVNFDGYVPPDAVVNNGDILIGMDGDFNVAIWEGGEAALNQRVACVRAGNSVLQKYIFYVLPFSMKVVNDLTYYTTVKHLSGTDIVKTKFPFPPSHELKCIVDFLDHETAKIDTLIEKQQQLIKLLKEKRQAVISHAVTKGLNPNALMRDSGVEWLGEVPAHWEVKRLKHISPKIGVGLVINPSTYTRDEGVYFIFGGDVKEYGFDLSKTRKISPKDSDNLLPSRLTYRDLVSVRVGYPGITAVVTEELDGANCASIIVIRKGRYNSDWLCAAMNVWVGRQQVDLVSYGAAQKQFNVADAIEFVFPVPTEAEQNEIAEYVQSTLMRFNCLSEKLEKQIELLKERRTALISAAVTGKIDVRDWQPPHSN